MNKEKKIWLCEQYAQKAWTLSLNLAQEAARAGHFGKGYAVVADETRRLANKLFEYAAEARFGADDESIFKGIVDFAIETGFLSVNTVLEILHVEAADNKINHKSVAVCADDVRNLALALSELSDNQVWENTFILPDITSPLKSTGKTDIFFRFTIGGVPLVENALNIKEVCYPRKANITGETFSLRGYALPIIDCSRRFDLPFSSLDPNRQAVMVINPDYENYHGYRDNEYAVLIDDLEINSIFRSKIGYNAPPRKDHAFANYVRECWDAVGGGQLIFVDWQKLIAK